MDESSVTIARQGWTIVGLGLLVGLIYLLGPILMPFVAGALLAYLLDPATDKLESWGLNRNWAVVVVFLVMLTFLCVTVIVVAPALEQQIERLIDNLPSLAAWFKTHALPVINSKLKVRLKFEGIDQISQLLAQHWQQAGGLAAAVIGSLSHSGMVVLNWAMNLLLIPVVMFYLLRDWDVLVMRIHDLLPRRSAPVIGRLAEESDAVLSAFLRGQLSVMVALAVIYSVGLTIVELDVALLIGTFAGLVSFVPYMGLMVGAFAGCIAAISQFGDLWAALPVLAVFGVGQLLEGTVLTPKLVGDKVGLHPVAVIFAVLAGGQLFGFLGVLLALPAASVIMVLLRHAHDLYKDSDLYGASSLLGTSDEGHSP